MSVVLMFVAVAVGIVALLHADQIWWRLEEKILANKEYRIRSWGDGTFTIHKGRWRYREMSYIVSTWKNFYLCGKPYRYKSREDAEQEIRDIEQAKDNKRKSETIVATYRVVVE